MSFLYILDATGKLQQQVPLSGRGAMPVPTVADVDGDGQLEIIVSLKDAIEGVEAVERLHGARVGDQLHAVADGESERLAKWLREAVTPLDRSLLTIHHIFMFFIAFATRCPERRVRACAGKMIGVGLRKLAITPGWSIVTGAHCFLNRNRVATIVVSNFVHKCLY